MVVVKAADVAQGAKFTGSRDRFETVLAWLEGGKAATLLQDHLDLRAHNEPRIGHVNDARGVPRPSAETGHTRTLATVFGQVDVERIAYRRRGNANLYPADAVLNLPEEKHSHGLRQLAAIEASRGSFDTAVEAIERSTGQQLGKRQVEDLAGRAAVDFDTFYAQRQAPTGDVSEVLVLSCDGKGVVMRPNALRSATAKAAATTNPKLATRLSKGEKRNRKRMAEVGAIYDTTPVPRTPADILPGNEAQRRDATKGPTTHNKWLTASVAHDAAAIVAQIFDEADRRDPDRTRAWVALVDGNNHQIDRIHAQARTRKVNVPILIDFVHTSWNTYGGPPGRSTPRETQPPMPGAAATPRPSSPAAPPAWPRTQASAAGSPSAWNDQA